MSSRRAVNDAELGVLARRTSAVFGKIRDGKIDLDFIKDLLNQLNSHEQATELQCQWYWGRMQRIIEEKLPKDDQARAVILHLAEQIKEGTLTVPGFRFATQGSVMRVGLQVHEILTQFGTPWQGDTKQVRKLLIDSLVVSSEAALIVARQGVKWVDTYRVSLEWQHKFDWREAELAELHRAFVAYASWLAAGIALEERVSALPESS